MYTIKSNLPGSATLGRANDGEREPELERSSSILNDWF